MHRHTRASESFMRVILQSAAEAGVVRPNEAQRPIDAVADADARSGGDCEVWFVAELADGERALIEAVAVVLARNGKGAGKFAGPVG